MIKRILRSNKAIFLDRDGVINEVIVKGNKPFSPSRLDDFVLLSDIKQALKIFKELGFLNIIVTNQPDIARGLLAKKDLEKMHDHIKGSLPIDGILLCPHDDKDMCLCRKPKPGLLKKAEGKWGIDLSRSYLIGDTWRDIEAGNVAGCTTVLLNKPYNRECARNCDLNVDSLNELAQFLKRQEADNFSREYLTKRRRSSTTEEKIKEKEFIDIKNNFRLKDTPVYNLCKRILDLVLAYLLVVVLSPVLLFVAICIKLSSNGPVFYKHKAVGLNGKLFYVYKFRTMHHSCDKVHHENFLKNFVNGNHYTVDKHGRKVFKVINDSRVFPIGKLLRKVSVDELPQLFNVIKGEMSFVGPRPPVLSEFNLYKNWHKIRVKVMPGISGYHQITGRSVDSFKKMFQKDLYYIRNRSFTFDFWVICKTVLVVLSCKGAH